MFYTVLDIGKIGKTYNLKKIEVPSAELKKNLNKRKELFYICPHFRKLYIKT